jgi:hypothetical protein
MACAAPQAFIDWLLDLPGTSALLLAAPEGRLLACSPALDATAEESDAWWAERVVVGEAGGTALALSLALGGEALRAWLQVPLEADGPGELLVLLSLTAKPQPLDLGLRLHGAYAERESRHSINQPLTSITFLIENLLFACLAGEADAAYLARKRGQMLGELARLRGLLERYDVLSVEGVVRG